MRTRYIGLVEYKGRAMTPAIKLLEACNVSFQVWSFKHEQKNVDFANEAVEKLGLDPLHVYKTILVDVDGMLYVAVLPSVNKVDLKAFARLCRGKKAVLADVRQAQNNTGYLIGGISPFAQKKKLTTFVHYDAKLCEHIYVSAGRRGMEIQISPDDLIAVCDGHFAQF